MSPTKIGILKLSSIHYFVLRIKRGACPQDFGNARVEVLGLPLFYPIKSTMEKKKKKKKERGKVRNHPRKTNPNRTKYYINEKDHHRE